MVVLLIEDDALLRDIFYEQFWNLGCKVLVAENGKIGLDILKNHAIDLILTDVIMPVMTGMEFLKEAKSLITNLPPIAVMTGGSPFTEKQFLDAGAVAYFDKVGISVDDVLSLARKAA